MSQKCSVAIIAGQLVVGGAERQLYLWLSHLDRERFDPVVLTLHPGHDDCWEKPIEALGIPLIGVPRRRNRIARLMDVIRGLRPYQPRLIHGWHLFASSYAGVTAKLLGARSLGSLRGSYRVFRGSPPLAGATLSLLDAILANSHSAGDQLSEMSRHGGQRVYTVQNAVEEHKYDRLAVRTELMQRFGLSHTSTWIGSMGRLDAAKRFDITLNTLALLLKRSGDFHLLMIGDGPERARLESLAEALGIAGHVTFAGEVPGAAAWLGALDIFCFTSLDEGLPNAVMEAAVAGLPIVAWRLPFIEEILEKDETALLVEPEDLVGLGDALLGLAKSPELRAKLGQAARNHVLERFSVERFVNRMTSVYEDLLGLQTEPDKARA